MLKYIFTSLLVTATFFSNVSFGQDVEDEVGFIYIKAEYLLETKRYAEAIKQYSEVIRIEPAYKEALLQRAKAKYAMASFRGVKDDVINHIKSNGVNAAALELLGFADYRQGNHEAALNSLNTALACGSDNAELYFIRGECQLALEQFEDACGNWNKAAMMGYNKGSLQANKYCGDIIANKPNSGPRPRPGQGSAGETSSSTPTQSSPVPTKPSGKPKPTKPGNTGNSGMDDTSGTAQDDEIILQKPSQPVDNSVNEIEVDDDLSLIIRNGLGGRELIQQPNILILADEGGTVAIDIVVNERGRVSSAEVNKTASSLTTASIVSLATRKAKEFWFEKSEWNDMEGTILFVISGR